MKKCVRHLSFAYGTCSEILEVLWNVWKGRNGGDKGSDPGDLLQCYIRLSTVLGPSGLSACTGRWADL